MTSIQQPRGRAFQVAQFFWISQCPNISRITGLASVKAYHWQRHSYILFEMQKSWVALHMGSSSFSRQGWEPIVSCLEHLFLQNWASESFLREVLPITPPVECPEETLTQKQRYVLCSITRIFGVSLSLSAIMSSIDSNVTLQTDWVLTPMTESC